MPSSLTPGGTSQYEVTLPCSPEDFREFIGGLLGKPQTGEQSLYGSYEVELSTLKNLHHLIDQRIHQQNDAELIQFVAKIYYDDDSTIQINNFDDFSRYQEVHPKVSTSVSLTWIYLITFLRKTVPERQQIDVNFGRPYGNVYVSSAISLDGFEPKIHIAVAYTERTWGFDLQSLISGHLRGLIQPVSPIYRFFSRYSAPLGVVAALLSILGSIFGVLRASEELISSQIASAKKLSNSSSLNLDQVSERIDYLISITGQGVWPRFTFAAVALLLLSLVLSVFIGAAVSSLAEIKNKAFILLTDASRARKDRILSSAHKNLVLKIVSLIASLMVGVGSNIVYTRYFSSL